jgi:ATP-dependent DNA helicase RecG
MDEEALLGSDTVLVDRLKLREGSRLTRAALLLFHTEPSQHFFGTSIKIGYFANEADLLYQDEIEGALIEQVEKAMDLLTTKYMKASIRYEGLQRFETLPFAKEAVREALLNAVVHKDYSSGIPIQIKVFQHKIVFWNSAVASSELTVEKLLLPHASHPHNPLVAGSFFRAGMIESWGRGIEKIHLACKQHGVAAPLIQPESNGVWVELYGLSAPEMTPEMIPEMTPETLNSIESAILVYLAREPQPTLELIAQNLNKGLSTIKRAVKKLQDKKILLHTGPNKSGRWIINKGPAVWDKI